MTRKRISSILKTIGLILTFWYVPVYLISLALSIIFWCDVTVQGTVLPVSCAVDVSAIEIFIQYSLGSFWYMFITLVPALIILGLGFALTPAPSKSIISGAGETKSESRLERVHRVTLKWFSIFLIGYLLLRFIPKLFELYA